MSRILVFIVAYNAERHIQSLLARIPLHYFDRAAGAEVLLIDDASRDRTVERAYAWAQSQNLPLKVFHNPMNQGYGGNQKLGYRYAIEQKFDVVVLLHGDGQYAPELLDAITKPIMGGEADIVIGSRMLKRRNALKGKMPFYKFVGNIALTRVQNRFLGSHLSEFHSGYRAWSVPALTRIPFDYNSPDFDFDTEILIQAVDNKLRICEIPIPTHYGDEVCHVDGIKYACQILGATIVSRLQKFGILYTPKYDYISVDDPSAYNLKSHFESTHSFALARISPGQTILDMGCGTGAVAAEAKKMGCTVIGIDRAVPVTHADVFATFIKQDLDRLRSTDLPADAPIDVLWLLDVIEHVDSPEKLLVVLRERFGAQQTRMILTTPNIAFLSMRLGLMLGQFNYGRRGILDMTHRRLFTFSTLRNLLQSHGYVIEEVKGIPVPFGLVTNGRIGQLLLLINRWLIKISRSLFAYEIAAVVRPLPTTRHLLGLLEETAKTRRGVNAADNS